MIEQDGDKQLAKGLIERIGSEAIITFQVGKQAPVKAPRRFAITRRLSPT